MSADNDNPESAARAAALRRQKALAELQQQIRTQRARLDPAVLAQVARRLGQPDEPAANADPATDPATEPATEPYDRAAATRAIELFIAAHKDKADFQARLLSFIRTQSH